MRIAVLYIGELRTITKVLHYFVKNVLECNKENTVHVFAVLQEPRPEEYEDWIRDSLGDHLQSLRWFKDSNDKTWIALRDTLASNFCNIPPHMKTYITERSGSMIEYYYTYLAYLEMVKKEDQYNKHYDYVIKARVDVLYLRPLDFHWLDWIPDEGVVKETVTEKSLESIMGLMLDSRRKKLTGIIPRTFVHPADKLFHECVGTKDLEKIREYINKGKYIITFRENQTIIARRDCYHIIPSLGTMYGTFQMMNEEIWQHWYDAETQLRYLCHSTGLSKFDYSSNLEISSLYEYNPDNFFDAYGNPHEHLSILFFLVRR